MGEPKWTKATRKKLHGFRRPHKADPPDAVPSLSDAWQMVVGLCPQVAGATPEVATMLATQKDATPPSKLTLEGEFARAALLVTESDRKSHYEREWDDWKICRSLVALWAEGGGLPFAVDVALQEPPFCFMDEDGEGVETLEPIDPEYDNTLVAQLPLLWAIRARLAACSESEFAEVRDACLHHIEKPLPPDDQSAAMARATTVLVFSRDRELAGNHIDQMLADASGNQPWFDILLGAAPDASRGQALAKRCGIVASYPFDFVESVGADAAPVLQSVVDRTNVTKFNKTSISAYRSAIKLATS